MSKSHYLSPDDLRTALLEHAQGSGDRLAECLYKIADGVLSKHHVKGEARDDLAQELVLKGWQIADTVDPNKSPFNYLTTCLEWQMHEGLYAAKRHRKIAERYALHLAHPGAYQEGEKPAKAEPDEPAKAPRLPKTIPQQKEQVLAWHAEGLSHGEIGRRLGRDGSTVCRYILRWMSEGK